MIYIPSMARSHCVANLTIEQLKRFAPEHYEKTFFVVPPNEVEAYKRIHDRVLACPAKGISATRQWIMDNATSDYVFMLDDDMRFSKRIGPKSRGVKESELDAMFSLLVRWMQSGIAHVAVATQGGANRVQASYAEITRANNLHGFRTDVFRREKIKYAPMEVMEDFHVTLTLLELGYKNRVLYDYTWSQIESGWQGGCSTYRTKEVQGRSARLLSELHKPFVRVELKTSGGLGEREDVTIQWKKAFGSKRNRRILP